MNPVQQLVSRLTDYPWWQVAIELAVLFAILWFVFSFVRGTRAAGALRGLVVLLVVATLIVRVVGQEYFPRLENLYDKFLGIAAIALVVTFQPELRRFLIRLGEGLAFRGASPDTRHLVDEITRACAFLSKNKFGAIIAIERSVGLREIIETGRHLNADVSSHLLNTIFYPNTPLHDMGVVIRGTKLLAASVQFPLADAGDLPEQHLGTRHRAAVGLARQSDALVIVVSEETGAISLAEGRQLTRWLDPEQLRTQLLKRLQSVAVDTEAPGESAESGEESGGEGSGASEPARPRSSAKKKAGAKGARPASGPSASRAASASAVTAEHAEENRGA